MYLHNTKQVMDMCAAPGSKTEQLLSLMQKDLDLQKSLRSSSSSLPSTPTGLVLANDVDPKRINTLMKRFSRCGNPHLLFSCARAEDLPRGRCESLDRVLCDVPCSGDCTFRKRPYQWRLFRST